MPAAANWRCAATFSTPPRRARFALTEVTLGIMPGAGGTQNLPRAVGERRAKEIILTGRPFSAHEAYDWGMVNRLCAPDRLLDEAIETAPPHRRQRADLGAPGQARDPLRAADGPRQRHDARDRGLQPHGPDRGPARGHRLLQRKAQTALSGPLRDATPHGRSSPSLSRKRARARGSGSRPRVFPRPLAGEGWVGAWCGTQEENDMDAQPS